MKKITAYKTTDGQVFEDEIQAARHQAARDIEAALSETKVFDGGPYDSLTISKAIVRCSRSVFTVLVKLDVTWAAVTAREMYEKEMEKKKEKEKEKDA